MFIVGLGHRARHGKDTVAAAIVKECATLGISARQYAFADALKCYCRVAFGMREKDAPLLQYVGTNIFRKYNPDIWVRVLLDTIAEQQPEVAVITDMRFPNEADAIKAAGGVAIKIERRTRDGLLYVTADRDPNHPSEIALTDYPFDAEVYATEGEVGPLVLRGLRAFRRLYDAHQERQAA